ncbi:MAG: peptidoglycan DD-metalloendopeptidase family protein [Bacteroidia bacterium]
MSIIPISLAIVLNPLQTQIELPITPLNFEPVIEGLILENEVPISEVADINNSISPVIFLIVIYIVGLILTLFSTIRNVFSVSKLVRKNNKIENYGTYVIEIDGINPSSFFNYIFIGSKLDPVQKQVIIAHEQWHYQKLHSLDLLVYQLYKSIFWFNPIVYLLEKELKQVHEFQVDKKVLLSEIEKSQYLACLVNAITYPKLKYTLTHQFYNHPLKNRIKMISKTPSKPVQLFKYTTLLIVVALSAYSFSSQTQQELSLTPLGLGYNLNSAVTPTDADKYGSIPSISPIKSPHYLSGFGQRLNPITKEKHLHRGIDLKASIGTPVLATGNGIVSVADTADKYGIRVMIRNTEVYETHFTHLSEILVEEGQKVKKGDVIAKSGNTGLSTGPHLHYEVIENGEFVDPAKFIKEQ